MDLVPGVMHEGPSKRYCVVALSANGQALKQMCRLLRVARDGSQPMTKFHNKLTT